MAVNPALQAYADAVNAAYDGIGKDTDDLVKSLGGIQADVTFLKDTIAKLQNTPGTFSTEDQALVDSLQARVTTLAGNLDAAKNVAAALDAATEEPPPVTPPTP